MRWQNKWDRHTNQLIDENEMRENDYKTILTIICRKRWGKIQVQNSQIGLHVHSNVNFSFDCPHTSDLSKYGHFHRSRVETRSYAWWTCKSPPSTPFNARRSPCSKHLLALSSSEVNSTVLDDKADAISLADGLQRLPVARRNLRRQSGNKLRVLVAGQVGQGRGPSSRSQCRCVTLKCFRDAHLSEPALRSGILHCERQRFWKKRTL